MGAPHGAFPRESAHVTHNYDTHTPHGENHMTPAQLFPDVQFDHRAVLDMLTDDKNAETYRRVLEAAIAYQEEHIDSDLWTSYDHAGFETKDLGAMGWEPNQFVRHGLFNVAYSSNSSTAWRIGQKVGDEWEHYHEHAATMLELARGDGSDHEVEADGVGTPLDDLDVSKLFTDVVGYEQEKKWYRRTLERRTQVHHLLVGEPGSGKSMMLDSIVENVAGARRVVLAGNQSTAQGVVNILRAEQPPVLVVEEIEKGSKADREALMTLCGTGYIQETKADGRGGARIELDTIVFAAGNDRDAITPPSLVDRFLVWEYVQYNREEFVEVCTKVLPRDNNVSTGMAEAIGNKMYSQLGSTSVRDAQSIASLAEDVDEVDELVALVGR